MKYCETSESIFERHNELYGGGTSEYEGTQV